MRSCTRKRKLCSTPTVCQSQPHTVEGPDTADHKEINVHVSLLSGEALPDVRIKHGQTVLELKRLLATGTKTPAQFQLLLCGSRELNDRGTLSSQQVPDNACIQLIKLLPDPPSWFAIEDDDPFLVTFLLGCRADLHERGSRGQTALIHATSQGFGKVSTSLLGLRDYAAALAVTAVDLEGRTALHWAAERGLAPACVALARRMGGQVVDARDNLGMAALHLAAFQGHAAVLEHLQDGITDFGVMNERSAFGKTPLHYVAACGHLAVCAVLLQHTSFWAVNEIDDYGRTALHWAAEAGHRDVCELLFNDPAFIEHGRADTSGRTALVCASCAGHAMAGALLAARSSSLAVNARVTFTGETALHSAALHGLVRVCKVLLDRVDFYVLDRQSLDGMNALHYAALGGHVDTCNMLVGSRAQVVLDKLGRTPLDVARQCGHTSMINVWQSELKAHTMHAVLSS